MNLEIASQYAEVLNGKKVKRPLNPNQLQALNFYYAKFNPPIWENEHLQVGELEDEYTWNLLYTFNTQQGRCVNIYMDRAVALNLSGPFRALSTDGLEGCTGVVFRLGDQTNGNETILIAHISDALSESLADLICKLTHKGQAIIDFAASADPEKVDQIVSLVDKERKNKNFPKGHVRLFTRTDEIVRTAIIVNGDGIAFLTRSYQLEDDYTVKELHPWEV